MDTGNQIYYFFVCFLAGYAAGMAYEIFCLIRQVFACHKKKNQALGIALDIAFFVVFAAWAVLVAVRMQLPNFRAYMWIAYLTGWLLYLKSLHLLLDFLKKVCYNCLKKVIKIRKISKNSILGEKE